MMLEWYVVVGICLLAGALIGYVGGILGIGGGLLAIPMLGLVAGMSQQEAQGTSLVMVLPAVLITVRKYNQNAKIDMGSAAAGAVSAIVFTWVGARFALGIDPTLLRRIYAVFILAVALFYMNQGLRGSRTGRQPPARRSANEFHKGWFALVGVIAGLIGGIFGVGGSVISVPILTTLFRLSQTGAQALALTMIIPGTCVGLLTYTMHGQANWLIGLPLALGSIFMVPYGVKLAYALPEPRLKLIFACMLLVIMVLLLIKA